jgi:hypothetical protein
VCSIFRRLHDHTSILQKVATARGFPLLAECGVDDESAAYRYKPGASVDANVLIIAFWHWELKSIQFLELWGHPFGLMSSVVNYNRGPELIQSATRALGLALSVHFYDDHAVIGLAHERGSAQQFLHVLAELTGTLLDRSKRTLMKPVFNYTGALFDATMLFQTGVLVIAPKEGRREKIVEEVKDILKTNTLTSGRASTLRGKLGYLSLQLTGHMARGCELPLIKRQYHDKTSVIAPSLRQALIFMQHIVRVVPDRMMNFALPKEPPVLLYTDAMFQDGKPCRMGFILHTHRSSVTIAGTHDVPPTLLAQFVEKKTHKGQAEILAVLLAIFTHRHLLRSSTSGCSSITSQH